MQLASNCFNFGLITVKSILLGRKTLLFIQRHFISLAMTACSRIEINPMTPLTDCSWVSQSHHNCYRTLLKSRESLVQFVGRPQLKNGNLWLKTESCSASLESGEKSWIPYCPYQHHVTLQCPANFLHKWNIGSPEGDPKSSEVHICNVINYYHTEYCINLHGIMKPFIIWTGCFYTMWSGLKKVCLYRLNSLSVYRPL